MCSPCAHSATVHLAIRATWGELRQCLACHAVGLFTHGEQDWEPAPDTVRIERVDWKPLESLK